MNEQERQTFLAAPHIGVLSVANTAGRPPHSIPLWYAYEPGGTLTFFTGTQGRKARKTALKGFKLHPYSRYADQLVHVAVLGYAVEDDLSGMLALVRNWRAAAAREQRAVRRVDPVLDLDVRHDSSGGVVPRGRDQPPAAGLDGAWTAFARSAGRPRNPRDLRRRGQSQRRTRPV